MHHVKDMILEPNLKMEFGESIQKTVLVDLSRRWKDPWGACLEWKMFPKTMQANWTDFVLDPRQASEYFKPPMFYKISLESFMFDALGYKSWIGNTWCIELPCPDKYTFNPV